MTISTGISKSKSKNTCEQKISIPVALVRALDGAGSRMNHIGKTVDYCSNFKTTDVVSFPKSFIRMNSDTLRSVYVFNIVA